MDNKKAYYAVIPANVRYDDDIPANAKLLYGEITALCNDKGYCLASNDYFAKLYNVSSRSISRWIKSLTDKGYIDCSVEDKEGYRRYLSLPTLWTKISRPIINNNHFKNKEMSLKAKGLLSLMLSLPENWNYTVSDLVSICKESETSIKSALNELKKFGYLTITKKKPNETSSGRFEYEYNIYEKPQKQVRG